MTANGIWAKNPSACSDTWLDPGAFVVDEVELGTRSCTKTHERRITNAYRRLDPDWARGSKLGRCTRAREEVKAGQTRWTPVPGAAPSWTLVDELMREAGTGITLQGFLP